MILNAIQIRGRCFEFCQKSFVFIFVVCIQSIFDDYRDFTNAIETDNFYGDCIIAFSDDGKITKRYYTSCDDQQMNYIESFISEISN